MAESRHCEIERKYLIAWIEPEFLRSQADCAVWEIEQIYLKAAPGETRRIRRVEEDGRARWYKTFKRRLTDLSCVEEEGQISGEDYAQYRMEADSQLKPIAKVRYRIPWQGQVLEFDLYPFWTRQAVLEVELRSEDQPVFLPPWVQVIREVTSDHRYKNVSLAREVPQED